MKLHYFFTLFFILPNFLVVNSDLTPKVTQIKDNNNQPYNNDVDGKIIIQTQQDFENFTFKDKIIDGGEKIIQVTMDNLNLYAFDLSD
jgi:hypothetical protein